MSRQPEVLWAQRSDTMYLTVSLPDAKNISVKYEAEGIFNFSAVGVNDESFNFTLQFYDNIVPQMQGPDPPDPGILAKGRRNWKWSRGAGLNCFLGCKTKIGSRSILCYIQKKQKGWWKRLLKFEGKTVPYIKVDWNKWCAEDEEESVSNLASVDDIVYTGENEESSDDDGMLYLPDLEKARGN